MWGPASGPPTTVPLSSSPLSPQLHTRQHSAAPAMAGAAVAGGSTRGTPSTSSALAWTSFVREAAAPATPSASWGAAAHKATRKHQQTASSLARASAEPERLVAGRATAGPHKPRAKRKRAALRDAEVSDEEEEEEEFIQSQTSEGSQDESVAGEGESDEGEASPNGVLSPELAARVPIEALRQPYQHTCLAILKDVRDMWESHPFRRNIYEIVTTFNLTGYLDVVKDPIDLETLETAVDDPSTIPSIEVFVEKLRVMLSNCAIYWCRYRKMSTEDVVKCARIVEAELLRRILKIHVKSFMWDKVDFTPEGSAVEEVVVWRRQDDERTPSPLSAPARTTSGHTVNPPPSTALDMPRNAPANSKQSLLGREGPIHPVRSNESVHSAHSTPSAHSSSGAVSEAESAARRQGVRPQKGACGTELESNMVAVRKKSSGRNKQLYGSGKLTFGIHRLTGEHIPPGGGESSWSFVIKENGRRLTWHSESTLVLMVGQERFEDLRREFKTRRARITSRAGTPKTPSNEEVFFGDKSRGTEAKRAAAAADDSTADPARPPSRRSRPAKRACLKDATDLEDVSDSDYVYGPDGTRIPTPPPAPPAEPARRARSKAPATTRGAGPAHRASHARSMAYGSDGVASGVGGSGQAMPGLQQQYVQHPQFTHAQYPQGYTHQPQPHRVPAYSMGYTPVSIPVIAQAWGTPAAQIQLSSGLPLGMQGVPGVQVVATQPGVASYGVRIHPHFPTQQAAQQSAWTVAHSQVPPAMGASGRGVNGAAAGADRRPNGPADHGHGPVPQLPLPFAEAMKWLDPSNHHAVTPILMANDITSVAILRVLTDEAFNEMGISLGSRLRIRNGIANMDAQFGVGRWADEEFSDSDDG